MIVITRSKPDRAPYASINDVPPNTQLADFRDYDVNDIIARVGSGDFGYKMDLAQQAKARAIKNIEPAITLVGDIAIVEAITFTTWGGFYPLTYSISRSFPHTIIEVKEQNLVPYDCGIMF